MPSRHCPKNVTFHTLDATKPPPDEFKGRYDVVHLRLVQAVVQNNDPDHLINHCKDLLRPGGHLQWDEHDQTAHELKENYQNAAPNIKKISMAIQGRAPVAWISELPKILSQHAMTVVADENKRELDWQREMMMQLMCLTADEYATNYLDKFAPPGSGDQARLTCQQALLEAKEGSFLSQVFKVVVARKSDQGLS